MLSNEITDLLKDSETNIFEQGEVANFIIELSDWLIFGFLVKSQSEHLDKWFNFL